MPLDWPLVGRREELAFIREALGDPRSRGVCLAGEAGVGKTRLVREAVAAAEAEGLPTGWGVGTEAARPIPFGALAHLLPLEDLAAGPGMVSGQVNVIRLAAEAILEGAGDDRPVLAIDDAHLLDHASATLVYHLASTGGAFVVSAVRSGEPAPDAVVGLWKEGLAERLELQALSRGELDELVESALGSQVEGATLHGLWTRTRGNPLFLRELVLGGLEAGSVVQQDGVWRWRGPSAVPRLLEVIEERLRRLEPEERAVLEVVAAADVLGAELLERLASAGLIEGLERRALLEEHLDGSRRRIRLSHPLQAEVLRAQTPPVRAREVRRRLGDLLEATGARRTGDLLRLATWRLEGGGPVRPDLFLAAARRAGAGADYGLAERLARAALQGGGGFEASLLLAETVMAQGRFDEGEEILAALEDEPVADDQLARAVNVRGFNLFWRLGRTRAALELVAGAETEVGDPAIREQLRAIRAGFLIFSGRNREGIDLVADLLDHEAPSAELLASLAPVTWGFGIGGRGDVVIALVNRVLATAEEPLGELAMALDPLTWLKANRAAAHHFAGRLALAEGEVEELYRRSVERGNRWMPASMAWGLSWIVRAQGRARTSRRWLREAVAILREVDMFHQLPMCLGDLAQTEALLGEVEEAERILAEAEAVSRPEIPMDRYHIGLGRAWTAVARGEVSRGAAIALETADELGSMGQHALQAAALHDAVRLGEARRAAALLEELAPTMDGELAPACAAHARALAEGDAAGLEEASRTFASLGALLLAAESAAQAAYRHRESGRKGSALTWQSRALALTEQCEGARTPALAELARPLPLTRREREVAALAARGLSNREIADLLVVSVRTVGNHLHNVYAKLGVSGRKALSDIFEPEAEDGPGGK